MGWFKNMVMKILNIQPATDKVINIRETLTLQGNVLRNRIWYRGDPSELDQFFKQTAIDAVGKSRFWAAVPSEDLNIRKIHSGLPSMIVDRLSDIVISDLEDIDLEKKSDKDNWDNISEDNNFNELLGFSIAEALHVGDGAFKISIDTNLTEYPIIEFYSGERVDYVYNRGRLEEILFYTEYSISNKSYKLEETYGKGYIEYKLYDDKGKEVPLSTIKGLEELDYVAFDGDFIMGVPLKFFKSSKFENRGKSIFDSKSECFDALDEVISQWIDAIRDGRVMKYIPEDLVPKNPLDGTFIKPNSFDNKFIAIGSSLSEDAKNQIDMKQAEINYEAYVNSYANAIDMCIQGIISPATLGIDLKKTDNAEAQREKEKATLYTRGKIIGSLNKVLPQLVRIVLMAYDNTKKTVHGEYEATVKFGEYASPSFDSVVETVGKAKTYGIMSIEKCVDELYGDTLTDEDKEKEVQRIKEDSGLLVAEEPKVIDNTDLNGENNGQE